LHGGLISRCRTIRGGHYSFKVGAKPNGGFEVQTEECQIDAGEPRGPTHHYLVSGGRVVAASTKNLPAILPDRLFLVAVSGLAEFRPAFDALSRIEVYNLNPREIRSMQKPDPGDLLRRDGSNAASVLQQIDPHVRARIDDYLSRIVPGIASVEAAASAVATGALEPGRRRT